MSRVSWLATRGGLKHPPEHGQAIEKDLEAALQHDRAQGAADHDHEGRELEQ
jgi:hypothetical protein